MDSLNNYDENLINTEYKSINSLDIMKVFELKKCGIYDIFKDENLTLIWEREEPINWREVERGTMILVKFWEGATWKERKFIAYVEDLDSPFITYKGDMQGIISWKYVKLK